MAKLIFSHASLLDSSGSAISSTDIYGIVSDSVEITLEPDTLNVENNREVYESYTGRVMFRTINTKFGASDNGSAILADARISNNGSLPTVARIHLHGKTGTHDIKTANCYIMGHQAFDNGRLETVIMAQAAEETGNTAIVVSDAS